MSAGQLHSDHDRRLLGGLTKPLKRRSLVRAGMIMGALQ